MSEVILRPVASTDLCARFARDMGENKIRHYVLPLSLALVKKFTGQDTEYVVRDFIKRTEGVNDVVFKDFKNLSLFYTDDQPGKKKIVSGYTVTDVSKLILGQDPSVARSLVKIKSASYLYQWNWYKTPLHKMYDWGIHYYNKFVVPRVNRLLMFLQGVDPNEYGGFAHQLMYKDPIYTRKVDPAHFISVAFESSDAERAVEAFREELRILDKNKLIKGHLCMPSVMALADTIGRGKFYVIFCFPIIDHDQLIKIKGMKSPLELPQKDQLSLVGLKYETMEGGVKWFEGKEPRQIYEVEDVWIKDLDAPERDQMVMQCYETSKDHINSVASAMKEELKNTEKIVSKSETFFDMDTRKTSVRINVAVKNKKTGVVTQINDDFAGQIHREKRKKGDE